MTDQVNEEKTIFTKPAEETTSQPAAADPVAKTVAPDLNQVFKDQLGTIVDDKGEQKYNDVITALEALKHAQSHIATLQEENKSFREKQVEEDTLKTALDNISAKKEPETTKSEGIDAEQYRGMTLETIKEYEAQKVKEANLESVSTALISKYGDATKAAEVYAAKAADLGIDTNTFMDLAAKSPKAVLEYFAVKSETPSTIKGSINSQAIPSPQKDTVDYSARFFNTSNASVSAWKAAGEDLIK